MRYTKLNHLLRPSLAKGTCSDTGRLHHWVASGEVRATQGGNVFVNLRCSRCNARETALLNAGEYELQKRVIKNSLNEQEKL